MPATPSVRWVSHSYDTTQQVPEVGELVMLAFPAQTINFPYGPRSTYAPSRQMSSAYGQLVTTTGSRFHYALVLFAMRNSTNGRTLITFLPVMSYSNRPQGFRGNAWDADAWMRDHASDLQKMYHLPIPAAGWTPPPNPHPLAPVVAFNNWLNNRPSWIAVTVSTFDLKDSDAWLRHPHGPIKLSGGHSRLLELHYFKDSVLPAEIADLQSRNLAQRPTVFYVELPDFHATHAMVISSLDGGSFASPPGSSGPEAMPVEWADRFDPWKAMQKVQDWRLSLQPSKIPEVSHIQMDDVDCERGKFLMLPEISVGEEAWMGSQSSDGGDQTAAEGMDDPLVVPIASEVEAAGREVECASHAYLAMLLIADDAIRGGSSIPIDWGYQ
ncbi:hypothetical protein FN846DRAFT_993182 [Sphaerosporella brunnea]|uniref:Uncharacterized protein n=1 Tax=Sphaerosporella brunnea TaxID=1250544 RepID=A0A5J5EPH4_9PEZI|nr:hypothetical protein FN846DRAFT_993182 [Sphaerosporella brunnea]